MRQDEQLDAERLYNLEYQRMYYKKNAERIRGRAREYQHEHRDQIRAQRQTPRGKAVASAANKRYYEKNKPRLQTINRIVYHIRKHNSGATYHDARVLAIRIYETVTKNFPTA